MMRRIFAAMLCTITWMTAVSIAGAQEYMTGIEWQKPPVIKPGKAPGDPPSDAIVLFDGKDFAAWKDADTWKIEDGAAVVGTNYIETKEHFGDSQLHIEWSAPTPPKGTGQGRGNSGVFFGPYELQVLDSYEDETYYDGQAGAIYKQHPPMVNAMRPPGEWNVYDVLWTAPRFKADGKLESPAYITVLHNGVAVQNHFELLGDTPYTRPPQYNPPSEQPIRLQDHGNPVKFRNIWIRDLKPIEGKKIRGAFLRQDGKKVPIKAASIRGEVTLSGKPLKQGKVTLFSGGEGSGVSGDVRDGVFNVGSIDPGDYVVTVEAEEDAAEGAKIAERFSDKDTSGLTVTVVEGSNQFAFELTSR